MSRRRSSLDRRGVMRLADHWLAVAWREKEHKKRPRSTVDAQLSEAEQLAGLIEELPPSSLLSRSCAADLREIVVATRVLCRAVEHVTQERSAFERAQEVRAEGRKWVRLVVDALRFVQGSTNDEGIAQRLARVDTIASSDAALAHSVSLCGALYELYEKELTELGVAEEDFEASFGLAMRVQELRHLRRVELEERAKAFHARDRLLGCLYRRVIEARSALRFIHREDPEVLGRLVSPSLREKRRKRGGVRHKKRAQAAPEALESAS